MIVKTAKRTYAKQKIINAAIDLFFQQGYLVTGINQIIKKADVAKATFYSNFSSKESLCLEYVKTFHDQWLLLLKNNIDKKKKPYGKLMAIFDFIDDWMKVSDFRGCMLMNIANEVPDLESDIRKEVFKRYKILEETIKELLTNLKDSDKDFSSINVKELTEFLFVIIQGAIATSKNYKQNWPLKSAKQNFVRLLKK